MYLLFIMLDYLNTQQFSLVDTVWVGVFFFHPAFFLTFIGSLWISHCTFCILIPLISPAPHSLPQSKPSLKEKPKLKKENKNKTGRRILSWKLSCGPLIPSLPLSPFMFACKCSLPQSLVWLKASVFQALPGAPHEYPLAVLCRWEPAVWICTFTAFTHDVVVRMGRPAFSIRLPALRWLTPPRKVCSASLKLKRFHSCFSQFVWWWTGIQLLIGMEIFNYHNLYCQFNEYIKRSTS